MMIVPANTPLTGASWCSGTRKHGRAGFAQHIGFPVALKAPPALTVAWSWSNRGSCPHWSCKETGVQKGKRLSRSHSMYAARPQLENVLCFISTDFSPVCLSNCQCYTRLSWVCHINSGPLFPHLDSEKNHA